MGREVRRVPADWQHPKEWRWDHATPEELARWPVDKREDASMGHSRVTREGQAMGKSAARLAELGRARLVEMGLDGAPRHIMKSP